LNLRARTKPRDQLGAALGCYWDCSWVRFRAKCFFDAGHKGVQVKLFQGVSQVVGFIKGPAALDGPSDRN